MKIITNAVRKYLQLILQDHISWGCSRSFWKPCLNSSKVFCLNTTIHSIQPIQPVKWLYKSGCLFYPILFLWKRFEHSNNTYGHSSSIHYQHSITVNNCMKAVSDCQHSAMSKHVSYRALDQSICSITSNTIRI